MAEKLRSNRPPPASPMCLADPLCAPEWNPRVAPSHCTQGMAVTRSASVNESASEHLIIKPRLQSGVFGKQPHKTQIFSHSVHSKKTDACNSSPNPLPSRLRCCSFRIRTRGQRTLSYPWSSEHSFVRPLSFRANDQRDVLFKTLPTRGFLFPDVLQATPRDAAAPAYFCPSCSFSAQVATLAKPLSLPPAATDTWRVTSIIFQSRVQSLSSRDKIPLDGDKYICRDWEKDRRAPLVLSCPDHSFLHDYWQPCVELFTWWALKRLLTGWPEKVGIYGPRCWRSQRLPSVYYTI